MSLLEITAQKKAELRADWENRIKKAIADATGTHTTIETHLFPAARVREMNTERSIICNILNRKFKEILLSADCIDGRINPKPS